MNLALILDREGYLVNLSDWSPEIAQELAQSEGIHLRAQHWELIELVRDFYQEYELSPSMRPLVKRVSILLGKEKGNSIYLLQMFPGNPAKTLAKIAGLPRPTHCI